MYRILIEKKAEKFLSKQDSKNYQRLSNSIRKLADFRQIKNLDIKYLKGKFKNMLRLRVGTRRILFTINETRKEIRIWLIEDRGNIY